MIAIFIYVLNLYANHVQNNFEKNIFLRLPSPLSVWRITYEIVSLFVVTQLFVAAKLFATFCVTIPKGSCINYVTFGGYPPNVTTTLRYGREEVP